MLHNVLRVKFNEILQQNSEEELTLVLRDIEEKNPEDPNLKVCC